MAIVTDLDDTLVASNGDPITPMLNLLLDAHQAGERIIVVSGRSLNRLPETIDWLDEYGLEVAQDDIHLSDFPEGPNASQAFKVFKAKKLLNEGIDIKAWYENDADTRAALKALGIDCIDPASVRALSPATPGAPVPTGFGIHEDPKTSAPQEMRDNAHDGLKFYAQGFGGDGLTAQTVREARDMVKGIVTNDKWKRIAAWVARHRVDWEGNPKNSDMKNPDWPGPGAVAAYLWGVDPTDKDSADKVIQWAQDALSKVRGEEIMSAVRSISDTTNPSQSMADMETSYDLGECLESLLGDVFTMYVTAHGYHWNVIGRDFAQFHELFQEIYEDVYSSIDPIAENIRKLNEYAPFTLTDLIDIRTIDDVTLQGGDGVDLARSLAAVNDAVIGRLVYVFGEAVAANQQGIANFIAERIDMHQKWAWQLGAVIGITPDVESAEVDEDMQPESQNGNMTDIVNKLAELFAKGD